jgi:nucleoside-diphosphate-sugar epimerase
MSKNILIIGSKGYLGKHIIRYLSSSNSVYVFNRKDIDQFICSDKIDLKIKFDVLINCIVDYNNDSTQIIESNFFTPIKICQKLQKSSNFKVFHFDSFYSKFFKLSPKNSYLLSKKSLIEWTEIFHDETPGITTFILRLEHVIGKNESKKKFNGWLLNKLKNNGSIELGPCSHSFDFIYIEDVVKAIILLINTNRFNHKFNYFEVGSGKNYQLKTFVNLLKLKLNSESKIIFNKNIQTDLYKNQSSIAKSKELMDLGWNPKSNLNEIIDLIL